MKYPEEFENLINTTKENLIGWGNPNAKILIVGKESAIPVGKEEAGDIQYRREILENKEKWIANLNSDISQDSIEPCQFDDRGNILNFTEETYNPLFPYKGQQCCVRRIYKKDDKIIKIACPKGTSMTWYNYQRLCDLIRKEASLSTKINDFHRFVFTTELSVVAGKSSKDVDKTARKESIEARKVFFSNDFFKRFPIIILAAGNYPDMFGISQESFCGPVESATEINSSLPKGIYKIVYLNGDIKRLFIRTYQLSMVSNDLIKVIADKCLEFINKYSIEL